MTFLSETVKHTARPFLTHHPVRWLAFSVMCLPFIFGSIMMFTDFDAAVREMESYGLMPSAPFAAAVIFLNMAFSLMIITGFLRWIAALALATFILLATPAAIPFWEMTPGPDRLMALRVFVEHVALASAFVLVAWEDTRGARRDDRKP